MGNATKERSATKVRDELAILIKYNRAALEMGPFFKVSFGILTKELKIL